MVLGGTITGLSSSRSIVLQNNGDASSAHSFSAAKPTVPTNGDPSITPFSFGSLPEGSAYNVTVKAQPYGRTCTVSNGSGTISAASPPNITIACVNATGVPRYNLTVQIPSNTTVFSGQSNPTVTLTTEEAIYVKPVTSGQTSVTFNSVLMNTAGQPGGFLWTVTASTLEGSIANKCVVTNATNSVAGTITSADQRCHYADSGCFHDHRRPGVQVHAGRHGQLQHAARGNCGYNHAEWWPHARRPRRTGKCEDFLRRDRLWRVHRRGTSSPDVVQQQFNFRLRHRSLQAPGRAVLRGRQWWRCQPVLLGAYQSQQRPPTSWFALPEPASRRRASVEGRLPTHQFDLDSGYHQSGSGGEHLSAIRPDCPEHRQQQHDCVL